MKRRSECQRSPRAGEDADRRSIDGSRSARYGPARSKRNIERSHAADERPFNTCTAARSAPPPLSDGSTKHTRRRWCGIRLRSID
jgi:hypothetical protein